MKIGQRSAGRMRGAIPPPRYNPPVDEHRQREIAGRRPVGRHEHLERARARRARAFERRARDRRRQIVGAGIGVSAGALMRMQHGGCSRGPVPTRRARRRRGRTRGSTPLQRLFVGVARREVDMPAFGRTRHQAPVDVRQQRDAEAGARGDQRDAARLRSARPSSEHFDFVEVSTGTDHASASRSFSRCARATGSSLRSASASTTHGTLVNCARVPVTGPATPKLAASMSAGVVDVSRRNCRRQRAEIGKVERAVRARPRPRLGRVGRRREEAEQGFRSADVACEQHR